jgi:2,3-bisphosphoglycerate-independent phosphoglycerate mutase
MKYVICVGDGMADFSIPELDNRTPLEYADTVNMDSIASIGCVGRVKTIPDGLPAGSDVGNMSLLGYDATRYYNGRAPIEAVNMGIDIGENDIAFRCNLVTLENGLMNDYSAGHIETEDAAKLINELQSALGTPDIRFYPGVSYRHILIISGLPQSALACTPPHDISGKPWKEHLPHGAVVGVLLQFMERAHSVLQNSSVNKRRIADGKKPATDIWLWGQGKSMRLPTMKERFGLTGSVISAVDLVQGLGVLSGLTVCKVEGATGYLDTNYAGKVAAAADALARQDFVFLHVEAPDETSHEGSLQKKIRAIEDFDKNIVGEMLKIAGEIKDLRIMVLPDHATPISLKTHHAFPVPFTACGPGIKSDGGISYSEKAAADKAPMAAETLFTSFIKGIL